MKNLISLDNGPLVSVIVPVYNVENYLENCVNSILNQTYKNIEIILVNDGSLDKSLKIAQGLTTLDKRIHLINHEKNMGLFQARITGVKASHGEYICFVDSDDKISVDWIRVLLNCALDNDCDLVAGDFCFDYGNNELKYLTLDPLYIKNWNLKNEEVYYEFLKQNYGCFSWHVVWNKLYKKDLWNKKIKELEAFAKNNEKLCMWEDLAFSSAMYSCATHFMNVHGPYYYYYKNNENSETSKTSKSEEASLKYINNVASAMQFFKSQIESYTCDNSRKQELLELWNTWNNKAYQQLFDDLSKNNNKKIEEELKSNFPNVKIEKLDLFCYELTTPISNTHLWFENAIRQITSSKTEYVSFDIFDTLIKRYVLKPTDLFEIVSNKLNEQFDLKCVDFTCQRISAEHEARKKIYNENPLREEITIDDIYDYLKESTLFTSEQLDYAKKQELDLELEFCVAKENGKYLYDLAKQAGKKIIIVSDMYLTTEFIQKILEKNNYNDYVKCYVSSSINLTKATGNLYDYVCNDLNIKDRKTICHIGDNYQSDYQNSLNKGLNACHLTKAEDFIFNRNPSCYTGNGINKVILKNKSCVDMKAIDLFLSIRCILGLMTSKFYNNKDCHVNTESDYNADPNKIGYMLLGPHLLSVVEWIKNIVVEEKIPTVHFVARDGYLVKKAYELLYGNTYSKSNYLRCSRKALLLADINKKEDFYNITSKLNIYNLTVEKLYSYFLPIIKDGINYKNVFEINNVPRTKKFDSVNAFNRVIKIFVDEIISMDKLKVYQQKMANYYRQIVKPGDYIFDIGYSGRPEEALSVLLGYPVGSMYIHTNNDVALKRQHMCNIKSFNFYDYKPMITGVIREHLIMELGPSTIGFKDNNGSFEPLLEDVTFNYNETLITNIIQENAIEFISDYKNIFAKYLSNVPIRKDDASSFLEDFIHYGTDFDIKLFKCIPFEDDLGMGKLECYKWLYDERINNVYKFEEKVVTNKPDGSILKSNYVLDNVSGKQVLARKIRNKHNNIFGKFILFITGLRKY